MSKHLHKSDHLVPSPTISTVPNDHGARVGQHLLNHVAKTVVVDTLNEHPCAVGRQIRP